MSVNAGVKCPYRHSVGRRVFGLIPTILLRPPHFRTTEGVLKSAASHAGRDGASGSSPSSLAAKRAG